MQGPAKQACPPYPPPAVAVLGVFVGVVDDELIVVGQGVAAATRGRAMVALLQVARVAPPLRLSTPSEGGSGN